MTNRPPIGMDPQLDSLIESQGVEPGSRAYLEQVRWPDGVACPRCDSRRVGFIETREKHQCCECAYQFRPTAGTVLHDSHIAISKWLLAVGLMLDSSHGYPANRLHHVFGGSYKSAWFIGHRIRAAMAYALLDRQPVAKGRDHGDGPGQERGRRSAPLVIEPAPEPIRSGLRLIKREVAGDYHRPDLAYLNAYRAEARWRALHLGDPGAYRKTVKALLDAEPLPYERLTRYRASRS